MADVLRTALLERRYQPGDELTDTALAKAFGVSRGPIREALIILAEEGVIEHRHHRGFRVPRFEAKDLLQINEARQPLEALALKLARERASSRDIAKLAKLKKRLIEACSKRTADGVLTARPDFDFHDAVWQLSGNPWLLAALRRICRSRFLYASAESLGFRGNDPEQMDLMHQLYIDYISGTSELSAEECVARHLALYASQVSEEP